MIFTVIGAGIAALGLVLLAMGTRLQMLCFVFLCSLFNGSATLVITALGSVSIPPALLATAFLALHCALPGCAREPTLPSALAENGWLLLLVGYSVVGAFVLPTLFEGAIAVVPLRPSNNPLGLTAFPLRFSTQNITTAAYMTLTLAGALCAHMAVRSAGAAARIARLASVIGLVHAAIGWSAAAARNTPVEPVFGFFRNGHYMQLDQDFAGFARLTGISPEPSLYASFGLIWFLFVTELWLRSVDRRWTGPAALVLLLTLIASTSTTAYVGLAAYSLVLLARQVFLVGTIPAQKGLVIGACLATLGASLLVLAAGNDAVAHALARVLRLTTADKLSSGSGIARLVWARQGIDAFLASWGFGIGAGSFRSSSIVTALLGSSGIVGMGAMALYLLRVFRPLAQATWRRTGMAELDVSSAAAWAVVMSLVPASVSAPSPDPGLVWGLLAGSALGLRRLAYGLYIAAPAPTRSKVVALGGERPGNRGYPGNGQHLPA